jgi:hypothetical protein
VIHAENAHIFNWIVRLDGRADRLDNELPMYIGPNVSHFTVRFGKVSQDSPLEN